MTRITGHAGHTKSELDQPTGPSGVARSRLGEGETEWRGPRQGPCPLGAGSSTDRAAAQRFLGCSQRRPDSASSARPTPTRADRDSAFAVKVYNYADVSPKTLLAAKRHAAKVYRKIGISTTWVDCPFRPEQAGKYPECAALNNGPSVLNLQILSKEMIEKLGFNTKTFGFALPTRGREFAVRANVFAHRVEALAYLGRPSKAEILGYVMAHELGHLFLGPGSHSSSGLMGFPWGKRRLRMAAEGSLKFTRRQGERIRAQVRDRVAGD